MRFSCCVNACSLVICAAVLLSGQALAQEKQSAPQTTAPVETPAPPMTPPAPPKPGIIVLPEAVMLTTPQSSQQLLVQRTLGDTVKSQVTKDVSWASANESIAKVSDRGVVSPVANGTTSITMTSHGIATTVPVVVSGMDQQFQWDFRQHVMPAITKAGCNMGACHGALAGKGGFRLSLQGYDPVSDYHNIVKQDRGRRTEFAEPARSLFVAKPSGAIPHKGGVRLDTESRDYKILVEWIANGAAAPQADDPAIDHVEVFPKRVTLRVGEPQRLIVQSHSTDQKIEDVTRWVKWTSTNETVCKVDQDGNITVLGPGEGAVMAWFSSKIAVARISVPFTNTVPQETYAKLEAKNFIDEQIHLQMQRLNLPPSAVCDDATFIRRAFLDTIGMLPTADEVRSFLADADENKREKLIDELLARPEFADYWTYQWCDILMLNGTLLRPNALKAYYEWIHERVEKNTPWNEFVHEILTASGDSYENGATNFYALYETPEDMTENACQSFLGLSIGCAKCHNHPLEKWTNDQYYGMANLFSRVRSKGWGGDKRNGDGRRTTFVVTEGELVQPRTGKPQPPTPLDGEAIPFDDAGDRREVLANWLTSPENPYFAKAFSNRVWANFFGTGLVESIDDLRVSNPASNDELLNQTAAFVVENKFDLKALVKTILMSNSYQRSSVPVPGNESDRRFYSRYVPRRLNAEVLHDAVMQVTEVPTKFDSIGFPGADFQKTEFYPLGTRAIQLYDSAVESYFLKTFGRNTRNIVCECERSNEPSMVQVLHLSNGKTVNEKLSSKEGRVQSLMAQLDNGMALQALIDEAYLSCLSRYPRTEERDQFMNIMAKTPAAERRVAIEDIFWALMTSREFMFNH